MNSGNTGNEPTLRQRFLDAVCTGQLGTRCDLGVVVTLEEFKAFFSNINRNYVGYFLPAATLEKGRSQMSHTKFVIRLRKGVYLVHPDAFDDG